MVPEFRALYHCRGHIVSHPQSHIVGEPPKHRIVDTKAVGVRSRGGAVGGINLAAKLQPASELHVIRRDILLRDDVEPQADEAVLQNLYAGAVSSFQSN